MSDLDGAALLPPPFLAVLTGLGERRRGAAAWLSVVAGMLFPITWIAWYLKDERPARRAA
ncbi:hypothetical protein [Nocardioides pantholopis]|uniref:hypothetical protein n=1 Tax=Nocardioides pantholopis TaxID=2483798 RepID=UPI000F08F7FF|nr:hypothetical protein [Nocardioides pantholopis]